MEKEYCTDLLYKRSKNHYIEVYLPFYYLLSQYDLLVFGLGTIGLLIVALFTVASEKCFRWNKRYNFYAVFLLYILIKDIIDVFISGGGEQTQINRIVEYLVVFFLIFIVCSKEFDEEALYKTWKIAGAIYIFGLIYHVVLIYVLGQGNIEPISIIPGYSLRETAMRPTSFFAEPAAFVTGMIPLEFLALKRKDMKWAIVSTLAILVSTSTTGIVLSVVLWGYTLMCSNMKKSYKCIMCLTAIVIIALFLNLDIFEKAVNKAIGILQGGGTLGVRVISGFEILKAMEWKQWIFGTSSVDVFEFVAQNLGKFSVTSATFDYYQKGALFLNGLCNCILNYGGVGLILLLWTYLEKLKSKKYAAKSLILVCLVAMFGQSIFLNSYFFQMTMLILLYCNCEMIEVPVRRTFR